MELTIFRIKSMISPSLTNTLKNVVARPTTWPLNSHCPTLHGSCPLQITYKGICHIWSCPLGNLALKILLPPFYFLLPRAICRVNSPCHAGVCDGMLWGIWYQRMNTRTDLAQDGIWSGPLARQFVSCNPIMTCYYHVSSNQGRAWHGIDSQEALFWYIGIDPDWQTAGQPAKVPQSMAQGGKAGCLHRHHTCRCHAWITSVPETNTQTGHITASCIKYLVQNRHNANAWLFLHEHIYSLMQDW